jgi:hypothetical protein
MAERQSKRDGAKSPPPLPESFPVSIQASADVKRPARKRARAETAAATVLKRIRQQKAAARKAAARYHAWQRRFWKEELDRAISPQANWRDVGQELRKIWRGRQRCNCYWCSVYQGTPRGQRENYWVAVVSNALDGNPSSLVKHLRRGLTPVDRNLLADTLAEILPAEAERAKQTKKGGRRKHTWAQMCADLTTNFFRDWKDANQRNGINDWGHRDEMKDEACRLAIELGSCWARTCGEEQDPPTFEQVRELIERPAARRH